MKLHTLIEDIEDIEMVMSSEQTIIGISYLGHNRGSVLKVGRRHV